MSEKRAESRPEISIIVPVYKVERYLNECIDSILAQTFTDFELILVDDGSPDGCPALCDAAAAKDSRIRVIHKPNGGVSCSPQRPGWILSAETGSALWIRMIPSIPLTMRSCIKLRCSLVQRSQLEISSILRRMVH